MKNAATPPSPFVAFVTVETSGAGNVATAHRLPSRIEQHVHDRLPEMRDLVVQVEPAS